MSGEWGKFKHPVLENGKVAKACEWVKESDIEVTGVDWTHNVDSQPDYTPSAPPEELVMGLYPSLEGLEEELNQNDAPEVQEVAEHHIGEDELPPPPKIVCVSCLLTGHQGGPECKRLGKECKNCGHEHTWKLQCKEVELTLKYGGDPMNLAPE